MMMEALRTMNDKIELTSSQKRALEGLREFINKPYDPDNWSVSLTGQAGVGKTFITQYLVQKLNPQRVVVTASTNKAVSVLSEVLPDNYVRLTIHKFLGLVVKKRRGETCLEVKNNYDPTIWAPVDLVLVDEATMVNEGLLKRIEVDSKMWKRRYIMIGDPYQLPPVNEEKQLALEAVSKNFALTEIVRQAKGNPIIVFADKLRQCIQEDKAVELLPNLLEICRGRQFTERVMERFSEKKPEEDVRVLAWTNARVAEYNQKIEELRPEPTHEVIIPGQPFRVNDKVMVNEAYVVDEEVVFNTGEEVLVKSISLPDYKPDWAVTLRVWAALVEGVEDDRVVYVLSTEGAKQFNTLLQRRAQECRRSGSWREFYAMQEFFIDLRPGHAMTVHKSQGSTYDEVFVDYRNILKNRNVREADRMLYVAVTRARHSVIIGV
jgi:exodeoxyribonuclease-5